MVASEYQLPSHGKHPLLYDVLYQLAIYYPSSVILVALPEPNFLADVQADCLLAISFLFAANEAAALPGLGALVLGA